MHGSGSTGEKTQPCGGLHRRVLPPSEYERGNGDGRYRRHQAEARYGSRQHRLAASAAGHVVLQHHRRHQPPAGYQPADDGRQHLEAHHPRLGLQPRGGDERGCATGGSAVGRRARRRGRRQQRQLRRDTERPRLADVRLGCHGGRRHHAPPADVRRGRDAGQRQYGVPDQQRPLRLQPLDGWQPAGLRVGCPLQRQDGPCLQEQVRRLRARLAVPGAGRAADAGHEQGVGALAADVYGLPPDAKHHRGRTRPRDGRFTVLVGFADELQEVPPLPAGEALQDRLGQLAEPPVGLPEGHHRLSAEPPPGV